jgi:hypothetical protein
MAGDYESAVKHYRIAAGGTTSIPEQNYLMTQAARLDDTNARREEATARFPSKRSRTVLANSQHESVPPRRTSHLERKRRN